MDSLLENAATGDAQGGKGRLLIVDDSSLSASILAAMVTKHGYEARVAISGEACLDVMQEFAPEVVLLDIEMPGGIDGYETCQRIRNRFDRANLTIIFLSAHDSLEERLHAYDAGGDDFVAKPFVANEILRKIALAVKARIGRRELLAATASLEESTEIALQGYNDIGAALGFARGALGCRTLYALADLVIYWMRVLQCECHVQLRGSVPSEMLTITPMGPATPLERSVFDSMTVHDRIFQFKTRMIVNYQSISILVVNMPVNDESLAGRIRDYVAIIAEAADDAVANILLRTEAVERAQELQLLAQMGRDDIERLQASQHAQLVDTRCEMERMVEKVEEMYYQFGLTSAQESAISDVVHATKDEVLMLFERYQTDFDKQFSAVLDGLNRASAYQVDMEEAAPLAPELWV